MAPAKRPATYADLEALPEHVVGEIIDGELFVSPRPKPRHAVAATRIAADLDPAFGRGRGGPGGWWILAEPELRLSRNVVIPDVAGWRRARMAVLPDQVGIELVPDWVCEVLSPSTSRMDRGKKMHVYAAHRIPHLWLVDPLLQSVEIYALRDGHWSLLGVHLDDQRIRAEPFAEVELALRDWWTTPPGSPSQASDLEAMYTP